MKRLPTLGLIALATVFAAPATAQMPVQAPPGGLDVNILDARTPVQVQERKFPCDIPGLCSVEVFVVPEGKRLVVEYLSLRTDFSSAAPGQSVQVSLNTQFHDQFQSISVGTTTDNGTGANSAEVFAGPVKAYAQSGASVGCVALAPGFESFVSATCTITGFLEDEN